MNRPQLADSPFGPSQTLWGNVSLDHIFAFKDRAYGWGVRDDFTNFASTAAIATSLGYYQSEGNSYKTFELRSGSNTTESIIPAPSTNWTVPAGFPVYTPNGQNILYSGSSVIPTPGQIVFSPAQAADNCQMALAGNMAGATSGRNIGAFTPYPIATGVQGPVFFECRIAFSSIANTTSWFIGLAGTLVPASGVPVGTTTYSTVPSLLGFGALSGDTAGQIGWVYNQAGGATVQRQGAAGMSMLNLFTLNTASAGYTVTLPGATAGSAPFGVGSYFKLGFKYDPNTGICTPYVNGVPFDGVTGPNKTITRTTSCGSTVPANTLSATLWPADQMNFAAGLWQTTASAVPTLSIDWYQIAQLQA